MRAFAQDLSISNRLSTYILTEGDIFKIELSNILNFKKRSRLRYKNYWLKIFKLKDESHGMAFNSDLGLKSFIQI